MRQIALLLVCLLLHSCVERIQITTDNQTPRLVIFGSIGTEPGEYTVAISRSIAYFGTPDPEALVVRGARVAINGVPLMEAEDDPGNFKTAPDFAAVTNQTYTLTVEVDFDKDGVMEHYQATAIPPTPSVIDRIYILPQNITLPGGSTLRFLFNFFYLSRTSDRLEVRYLLNDRLYNDRLSRYVLLNGTPVIENTYLPGYPALSLGSRIRFAEKDTVELAPFMPLDIEVLNHSAGFYGFALAARKELGGGNPLFSGPPADIPSNLSNGAMGAFGAYATTRIPVKMPWGEVFVLQRWENEATGAVVEFVQESESIVAYVRTSGGDLAEGEACLSEVVLESDAPRFRGYRNGVLQTWEMRSYIKLYNPTTGEVWSRL